MFAALRCLSLARCARQSIVIRGVLAAHDS